MARQKIMPEFVRDAEILESDAVDVSCVGYAEVVTQTEEHSGNALRAGRLCHDLDANASGEVHGINGKLCNAALLDDGFRGRAAAQ